MTKHVCLSKTFRFHDNMAGALRLAGSPVSMNVGETITV